MLEHKGIEGFITNIQRFSMDDGPGIRSTVFLKGCNLACIWCHNPETIPQRIQLQYIKNNCRNCGNCVAACPNKAHVVMSDGHRLLRECCNECLQCVSACNFGALAIVGRKVTSDEVCEDVLRDKEFYWHSGGGVTISGGEPLIQVDFCVEILKTLRQKGIHTAIDTAGCVPQEFFDMILPNTDLILFDLKLADSVKHQAVTGQENNLILQNLEYLCNQNVPLWIRTPLIAEINDTPTDIEQLISLLKGYQNIQKVQLLPYHAYGTGKYAALGMDDKTAMCSAPSEQAMQEILDILASNGIENVEYEK